MVVIDFGIVYFGYVYLFKVEWFIVMMNKWSGGDFFFYKILSVLLLNLD